jgi:2-methylcitrate dehydratase PrpD
VTIKTTDGRSYSARVDIPRGDASLPLTDDELLRKYRDCAHAQLSQENIERSVGLVRDLEKVEDVGTLLGLLRAPLHKA